MTPVNTKKWLVGGAVGVALGGALVGGLASVASADATATPSAPSTTASTGSTTATKASAAVTAKDSTVKVTSVGKDADGSYDALGTKDGKDVFYDVSADLATVTLHS